MTVLATPVGKVQFSQLEEPKAFQDNPENPKKFTISVEFEGEAAKNLRLQLIELGKATKLVDGKLKVTFSRRDRDGKPNLVGSDKKALKDRPAYIPRGTDVRVSFIAKEAPMGVYLVLEGVMIAGEMAEIRRGPAAVEVTEVINPEFLDIF